MKVIRSEVDGIKAGDHLGKLSLLPSNPIPLPAYTTPHTNLSYNLPQQSNSTSPGNSTQSSHQHSKVSSPPPNPRSKILTIFPGQSSLAQPVCQGELPFTRCANLGILGGGRGTGSRRQFS